ncbi:MAG: tyrosine-type recombinase/integrase [Dietzia sp.]
MTVWKVHVTIGAVFDAALDEGLVVVNPARKRAARPSSAKAAKASRGEVLVWTAPQLRAFLGWAREYEGADATLWEVDAATGCRRSELLALRWSDVDLRGRRVKVRQAVDSVTREMKGTKSGRARVIDIDESTVASLKAWRSHRGSLSLDFVRGDGLVFGDLEGGVRNVNSVSLMFTYRVRKARKALGADALPTLTLHGLRHTHATLLLEAGENPKVAQERLGHASITITMDIYAHVTATMQRSAADRFGALLGG